MKKIISILCIIIIFVFLLGSITVFADAGVTVNVTPGVCPSATTIKWSDSCHLLYGLLPKQFDITLDGTYITSVARGTNSYSMVVLPGKHTVTVTAVLTSTFSKSTSATFTVTGKKYYISYDANGGIGVPEKQSKTYGTTIQLSDTVPTREGYAFLGWATTANAEVVEYKAGDTYTANEDATLYAVWEDTYVATPVIQISNIIRGKSVSISCDTANAMIYYTADGTVPNSTAHLYSEELCLTTVGSYEIKAIAIKGNYQSEIAEMVVVVPESPFVMDSGTDANGISWVLDSTGVLTVSGNGAMEDYSSGVSPFCSNTNIYEVIIGEGITHIGSCTFYDCTSITNISIPEGVLTLGIFAFNGCSSLDNVVLPSTLTSFDEGYEFRKCTSLTSIVIPDGIETIGIKPFEYCTSLKEISIPSSVTSIDLYAFKNCESLTDVCFSGTEEEWAGIQIEDGNDYLLSATIHYNSAIYKVLAPVANVDSSEIEAGTKIELSCLTDGATIYYTLDETEPTKNSLKYIDGIVVWEDTVLRAIAVKDGMKDSDGAIYDYTVKQGVPSLLDYTVTCKKTSLYYKFYITFDEYVDDANLYIALYDSSGKLLSLVSEPCEGDDYYIISVPLETGAVESKTFVWAENIEPISVSKNIDLE